MENNASRICSRCVMDTSDPRIVFDVQGVCNHCKDYYLRLAQDLHYDEAGQKRLRDIVARIKSLGKDKPYDCIIGMSGGIDSTFVAYKVKELGLRPLAVHLDNGWDSELAISNIEKVLKALDIDLYTHVMDWEEFRNLQVAVLRSSTVDCELPTDNAIFALMYRHAAKLGLRYIISGTNIITEALMPPDWVHLKSDWRMLNGINSRFSPTKLDKKSYFGLVDLAYYTLIKKIRWIPLLNYIRYNKDEAKKIMADKFGWRDYGGKHYESIYTRFYQGYILPKKFNIDKRSAHYSALVCAGHMERSAALELLKKSPYESELMMEEDKEYVIKKLGLTANEFEEIISAPRKDYSEYPNEYQLYKKMKGVVGWGKKIATAN